MNAPHLFLSFLVITPAVLGGCRLAGSQPMSMPATDPVSQPDQRSPTARDPALRVQSEPAMAMPGAGAQASATDEMAMGAQMKDLGAQMKEMAAKMQAMSSSSSTPMNMPKSAPMSTPMKADPMAPVKSENMTGMGAEMKSMGAKVKSRGSAMKMAKPKAPTGGMGMGMEMGMPADPSQMMKMGDDMMGMGDAMMGMGAMTPDDMMAMGAMMMEMGNEMAMPPSAPMKKKPMPMSPPTPTTPDAMPPDAPMPHM